MSNDICFFKNQPHRLSQYQTLEYATDIIKECLVQALTLKGKRQLFIVRREDASKKQVYVIYNHVLSSGESFGFCFVFKEKYPKNIRYIFTFCGKILSDIVREGKILYMSDYGELKAHPNDLSQQSALLKPYLEEIWESFDDNSAKLFPLSSLTTYNKIFKSQRIVHELSDTTWSMTKSLNYNNIVVFTEENEEENINSMRCRIQSYKKTIEEQRKEIDKLKAELDRQNQLKSNVLSSILGNLQFTPSKQFGITKTRKSLIHLEQEKVNGKKSLFNKNVYLIILFLFAALIGFALYYIYTNPSLKLLLIPN